MPARSAKTRQNRWAGVLSRMSQMKILKKLALAAAIFIALLAALSAASFVLSDYSINNINEQARRTCEIAIPGEEIDTFKQRAGLNVKEFFLKERHEHGFIFNSHWIMGAAICFLGVEQNRIVSKRVEEAILD
jgi:hypothetical protein